jgi:hypothetical protein
MRPWECRHYRLGRWRHDAARQGLMCAALDRIPATPGLSSNTYDMVAKSLGTNTCKLKYLQETVSIRTINNRIT